MIGRSYPPPQQGGGGGGGGAAGGMPLVLLEACTSENLGHHPDWGMNLQLVDLLINAPYECPLVFEALKKKLRGKSHVQGVLAVTLLEALVKNVPACHELVGTRDFLEGTLVKSLPRALRKPNEGPSLNSLINEPSDSKSPTAIARWEATLKCIQSWALAFDSNTFPIFHEVHRMLERRGVRFPPVEKEENAPVFLPPVAAGAGGASSASSAPANPSAPHLSPAPRPAVGSAGAAALAEIKTTEETVGIFTDMLDNTAEGYPLTEDELIQQLYVTCRSNAGILSGRLTHAANADNVDESLMMQLLAAHEKVLVAMKYYENLVSGIVKPRGANAAATAAPVRRQQRADDGESKQESKEEEHRRRGQATRTTQPPLEQAVGLASAPPAAVPVRARRKSDLPDGLAEFDMLGITPSPPPPAAQAPPQPKPQQQEYAPDTFDMSGTPFPPASNPMAAHLSVQPHAPASSPAPSSSKRSSGGLLAPPPATSTRHRKDGAAAKRGIGAETPSTPVVAQTQAAGESPARTPSKPEAVQHSPPQQSNLFNLDLLMASNAPASSTMQTPVKQQQQQQQPPHASLDPFASHPSSADLFASHPSSAFPFAAASGFPAATAPAFAAAAAPQTPFDADVPASSADNPFASFDQGDPFEALAQRPTTTKAKQTNAFDF